MRVKVGFTQNGNTFDALRELSLNCIACAWSLMIVLFHGTKLRIQ